MNNSCFMGNLRVGHWGNNEVVRENFFRMIEGIRYGVER